MTSISKLNPSIYFLGCLCHIVHNAANFAAASFCSITRFDVQDMMIDIFYWFDISCKRRNILAEYFEFCDSTFKEIIRHVSTRWLTLHVVIERTLEVYAGLRSYFLSESEKKIDSKGYIVCLIRPSLRFIFVLSIYSQFSTV